MKKTTILLPEDLQRRARSLAKLRNTNLSVMIREQLELVVKQGELEVSNRANDPLFQDWKPSDSNIPSDLSLNHDDYLYGE